MRMSRKMAINASRAIKKAFQYSYTGQSYFDGDPEGSWVLYLFTSGTLTVESDFGPVDIFYLSGGSGGGGSMSHGGGGGFTRTLKQIGLYTGSYPAVIGAGGASGAAGGASAMFGINVPGANADGSGGSGGGSQSFWAETARATPGSNGANGGGGIAGQGSNTHAFGDPAWTLYAGGGAAYCGNNEGSVFYPIAGGAGGGGNNGSGFHQSGSPGTVNYGGGGGSGHAGAGAGGSGNIIIRNAR